MGTGDGGLVTVKARGTADKAPSTISRSMADISGKSDVVRNGEPRFDPRSCLNSRSGVFISAGGVNVDVDGNWKRAVREPLTFREKRRE